MSSTGRPLVRHVSNVPVDTAGGHVGNVPHNCAVAGSPDHDALFRYCFFPPPPPPPGRGGANALPASLDTAARTSPTTSAIPGWTSPAITSVWLPSVRPRV